jgi:hypothetical protein
MPRGYQSEAPGRKWSISGGITSQVLTFSFLISRLKEKEEIASCQYMNLNAINAKNNLK